MVVAHMAVLGKNWWFSNIDTASVTDMQDIPLYWMPLPEPPTTEDCDEL